MTITRVASQAAGAASGGDADATVAFPGNVTAGNTILVFVSRYTPSSQPLAAADVTKSAGTATLGTIACDSQYEYNQSTGVYLQVGLFSAQVTGTGSLTMKAGKKVTNGQPDIGINEYHSDAGSNVIAFLAGTNKSASAATGTPATASATSTGSSIFAGALATAIPDGTVTHTPGSTYTQVYEQEDAHLYLCCSLEDKLVGATTSTADWQAPTTYPWAAALAVYQEASVPVSKSDTDSGALADATYASRRPDSDSATAADSTAAITGALPGADSGALSEAALLFQTSTDSLTLAEAQSAYASGRSDDATETEAEALTARLPTTDSATLTDAQSVITGSTVIHETDLVTGSETQLVMPPGSDSAAVAETYLLRPANSDSDTLGETTITVILPSPDGATASETAVLAALLPSADSLTLTDAHLLKPTSTDSATLVEAAPGLRTTASDSLTLTDSAALTAALAGVDSLTLGESEFLDTGQPLRTSADAFTASESEQVWVLTAEGFALAEAHGQHLPGTDSATLSDSVALGLPGSDSAALAEAFTLLVNLAGSEALSLIEVEYVNTGYVPDWPLAATARNTGRTRRAGNSGRTKASDT